MNFKHLSFVVALMLGMSNSYAADQKLVLTGASTIAPLALELGKRFEKLNPGVRVDVQSGGSSRGLSDARNGTADIGMVSRALHPTENDVVASVIAHDGVSIILHRDNPVKQLSDDQIKAIYTGKITNWKDVGGRDAPITVVNKAEGRSTLELFLHHFSLTNSQIKAHVIIGDNPQGIKTVVGNPNAIAYVSIGAAEYEVAHGIPLRLMPMNNVVASSATVRNGSFPLTRPLNLVTKQAPTGLAKRFIEFAQSDNASDLVRAQSFVPVKH
jgi:phosphate transport system substrate-binding protein